MAGRSLLHPLQHTDNEVCRPAQKHVPGPDPRPQTPARRRRTAGRVEFKGFLCRRSLKRSDKNLPHRFMTPEEERDYQEALRRIKEAEENKSTELNS